LNPKSSPAYTAPKLRTTHMWNHRCGKRKNWNQDFKS